MPYARTDMPTDAEVDAAAEALIIDAMGAWAVPWYREYPEKQSPWCRRAKLALGAAALARKRADGRAASERIFTCRKCEANYTVDEETNECPVCGTRAALTSTEREAD